MHALLAILLAAAAPNLDATTETLELQTSSTATVEVAVNWVDFTTSTGAPAGSGSQLTQITTATTTTILAAPAASTTRAASLIRACNTSTTAANTVTLKHDASATERRAGVASLGAGECVEWRNDGAQVVYSAGGVAKVNGSTITGGRVYTWNKSATAVDTVGYHYAYFKDTGFPGAYSLGTPGLNGVATDCSVVGTAGTGGALTVGAPIVPSTGNLYLASVTLTTSVVGTYQLVDVMWLNTGLTVTTTTAQAITTPTLPARDDNGSTNGEGVRFALLTTTANTNAAAIANGAISYTDSDGNAGSAGAQFAAVGFQTTISPVIGTWTPFYLAAGDRGIRALASVTLGTSYVAGALSAVLYRPIATVGVSVANNSTVVVPSTNTRVWPGSCLAWVALGAPATTAPLLTAATVQLVER